jgi:hypothetical protein
VLDSGLKSLVVSAVDGMDDLGRSVVSLFDDSTPTKTSHCKQSARGPCYFGDTRRFTTQTSGETGGPRDVPRVGLVQAIKTGQKLHGAHALCLQ